MKKQTVLSLVLLSIVASSLTGCIFPGHDDDHHHDHDRDDHHEPHTVIVEPEHEHRGY